MHNRRKRNSVSSMTIQEYCTTPPQEIFDEIKAKAIEIWKTYDDTYEYATNKIKQIEHVSNHKDNTWFIVAMFDQQNQAKLLEMVSDETRAMIEDAMSD